MNGEATSYPPRERTAADHDEAYTFGRPPSTYLAPREVARLLILRSRLREPQEPRKARRTRKRGV